MKTLKTQSLHRKLLLALVLSTALSQSAVADISHDWVDMAAVSPSVKAMPASFVRFSDSIVSRAAFAAKEVYNVVGNGVRESETRKLFDMTTGFGAKESGGFIDFDGKNVLVSFHGTVNLNNWLTNLQSGKVQDTASGVGLVHAGFKSTLDSAMSGIRKIIQRYAAKHNYDVTDLKFTTTGHSLGAVLATYCGYYLIHDEALGFHGSNNGRVDTISFASPRLGDSDFAKEYARRFGDSNHLRFGIWGDVVPAVPFGSLLGYKHVGTYINTPLWNLVKNSAFETFQGFFENPMDFSNPLTAGILTAAVAGPAAVVGGPVAAGVAAVTMVHSMGGYQKEAVRALEAYRHNPVVHQGMLSGERHEAVVQNGGYLGMLGSAVKSSVSSMAAKYVPTAAKVLGAVQSTAQTVVSTGYSLWGSVKGMFL